MCTTNSCTIISEISVIKFIFNNHILVQKNSKNYISI